VKTLTTFSRRRASEHRSMRSGREPVAWAIFKGHHRGSDIWVLVQWATVAMGYSEAWRNSAPFQFPLDLFKYNSNPILFELKSFKKLFK
jgi:hypothetical protein